MKLRFNIALLATLALGMAACSDDEYTGEPQVTPAEPTMPANGMTAADALANGAAVDLNTAVDGAIRLLDVTRLENFPSGSELQVVMKVAKSADLADAKDIVMVTAEGTGSAIYSCNAPTADLNEAILALYGKEPVSRTVYTSYTAYAVDGTSSVLLGAVGASQSLNIMPLDPGYVIEPAYYIINTLTGDKKQFTHSEGKSVYDDPEFSVIINVSEDGYDWKIVPASALSSLDAAKMYGIGDPSNPGAAEGSLALGAQAGSFEATGPYQFSVNMETLTYSYKQAYEYLYLIGDAQSWNWENGVQLTTKDYEKYGAFAAVNGTFKMTTSPAWTQPEIGSTSFTDSGNGLWTATAEMGYGGINNMDGLPAGLWAITFNMDGYKMQAKAVTSLEFIGTATGGWGDGDVQKLTPSEVNGVNSLWTGNITFTGSDDYKIRANGGWEFSLGGAADQLIWDGPNIPSPEAGTYKVTLNLNSPVLCIQFEKL